MSQTIKKIAFSLIVITALFLVELCVPKATIAAQSAPTTSSTELLKQASEQVVDEVDTTKNIFGKTKNGEKLIDQSREKAKGKLQEIKSKAKDTNKSLPPDEQKFVDNLQGE